MNINILHLIEGAKKARGLTVVIDVFRAFSVEAYLLAKGAERIIPIGDAELAYSMKHDDPRLVLAGERGGKIMPGFDTGNSPSQLANIDVKGKTVIHTTSAGTQGIVNAVYADEILGGSLVNAKATAEYIRKSGAETVSLVCMGLEGATQSDEDTLCALYIKSLLENSPFDPERETAKLQYTSGAKFFDPEKNDVFPRDDFYMCTDIDIFDFVLKLERPDKGIPYIRSCRV
ncbi:MAG: 2-phosphosulfolactate phosphatase [Ruminococcaceae bacterium]|nr:2-phosphosulfolactate phosphatase [Oscillospiraceae bacterium]